MLSDILSRRNEESRSTAGRIAYNIIGSRSNELHHHLTDMLGSTELTVLTSRAELAQHILIEVALHIKVGDVMLVKVIQTCNYLLKHLRIGYNEHSAVHVARESSLDLL